MGILPMDQFLCWKLKVATMATAIFVIAAGVVTGLLELLDIIAQFSNFDISGGFKATWRMHVWEGWLACNLVMLICHITAVVLSAILIWAIKRWPTLYEVIFTKTYMALLIVYILVELGTTCYKYSWYGPNTFRLAYLVFSFLFWLLRSIIYIVGIIIIYSRISEIKYEIKYGEKKHLTLMEMRSGFATPRSGYSTPHNYSFA